MKLLRKNIDRKINICGLLKYCYRKKKMLYVIVIFLSIVAAVGQQYIVNQNNISYVDNYEREINNANVELSEVESRIDYLQNYYNSVKETYINGSNNIVHKDFYLKADNLNADTKSMVLNNISDINDLDIDWDSLTHVVGFDDVDLIKELIKIGVHEDFIGIDVFCSTEEKGNIVTEYLVNAINDKYNGLKNELSLNNCELIGLPESYSTAVDIDSYTWMSGITNRINILNSRKGDLKQIIANNEDQLNKISFGIKDYILRMLIVGMFATIIFTIVLFLYTLYKDIILSAEDYVLNCGDKNVVILNKVNTIYEYQIQSVINKNTDRKIAVLFADKKNCSFKEKLFTDRKHKYSEYYLNVIREDDDMYKKIMSNDAMIICVETEKNTYNEMDAMYDISKRLNVPVIMTIIK